MSENENPNQPRRRFTGEEKFKIIKEQITAKTSVSEICKKYGIYPSQFYDWQEQFFQGAQMGFEKKKPEGLSTSEQLKMQELEFDNKRMKDVIAEITAENIAYKKRTWDWTNVGSSIGASR